MFRWLRRRSKSPEQASRPSFGVIELALPPAAKQAVVEPDRAAPPVDVAPAKPKRVVPDATRVRLAGEFGSAAGALTFAGALDDIADASFGRLTETGRWWVRVEATIPVGRQLAAAAGGRVFVYLDGAWVLDAGWGAVGRRDADASAERSDADIAPASLVDLVRCAGLHEDARRSAGEFAVLVPGTRSSRVIQRALDLELDVRHRVVELIGLFDDGSGRASLLELRLRSPRGPIPASFLNALDRDPAALVCRVCGERLLLQHGRASPLPDVRLAQIADQDDESGTWVIADRGHGSTRLLPAGAFRDSATMVRLLDHHRLEDDDASWLPSDESATPDPPELQLLAAATRGVAVDGALLDDSDLTCLPALLEGSHLADVATLVRGRDRHLLTAPGGLLERLPVGEPLYRLGPGPIYVPLGLVTRPQLPPAARQSILNAVPDLAIVLLRDAVLGFSMEIRQPAWMLWAGPLPPVDRQLPADAERALRQLDPRSAASGPVDGGAVVDETLPRLRPVPGKTWRDEALGAELSEDLVRAAELNEANGEFLRAAYLFERAARAHPSWSKRPPAA